MYLLLNKLDAIEKKIEIPYRSSFANMNNDLYRGHIINGSKWFVRTDVEEEWVPATPDQVSAIEQFFRQDVNKIRVGSSDNYFMIHRISGNTYVIQDRTNPKVYREIKKIGHGTVLDKLPK
jgi:hypothetical protein